MFIAIICILHLWFDVILGFARVLIFNITLLFLVEYPNCHSQFSPWQNYQKLAYHVMKCRKTPEHYFVTPLANKAMHKPELKPSYSRSSSFYFLRHPATTHQTQPLLFVWLASLEANCIADCSRSKARCTLKTSKERRAPQSVPMCRHIFHAFMLSNHLPWFLSVCKDCCSKDCATKFIVVYHLSIYHTLFYILYIKCYMAAVQYSDYEV